tara:strand:- start:751 stop:1833 length:1083 start_codon:yes stop_codon:yes gene_type:complete
MKDITIVAGARPNFMKIAPLVNELSKRSSQLFKFSLVHTGQHYDKKMSGDFFEQLNIPNPKINLMAKGNSHSELTASIMIAFEKYLMNNKTDLVIVVGDVTSTMACAIVAKKLNIKVAHIEGGIRSGDFNMPEEINRIVTDSISDFFFTTSTNAGHNLIKSGHRKENIFFVGNTMIDTLSNNINKLIKPKVWYEKKLNKNNFLLMTLHRPDNVDKEKTLIRIINDLVISSNNTLIIFPVHPRTKKNLMKFKNQNNLILIDPLSYLEFIFLLKNSIGIITDSGGITEEATVLNVPCITLRNNTERPETVSIGTNELVGIKTHKIKTYMKKLLSNKWKKGSIPELWDGKTSKRIIDILEEII